MMWNYNLDEMPKDGSEIVVCLNFKNCEGNELNLFYTIKFVFGYWHNYPSLTKWWFMQNVFCWALAPEEPESEGVEKLIECHYEPDISSYSKRLRGCIRKLHCAQRLFNIDSKVSENEGWRKNV